MPTVLFSHFSSTIYDKQTAILPSFRGKTLLKARYWKLNLGCYCFFQEAAEATMATLEVLPEPFKSMAMTLVDICAYAGTGNVLKIQVSKADPVILHETRWADINYILSLNFKTQRGSEQIKSNRFWKKGGHLSGIQLVGLPDFRSHLKSGPFANQPLFHH